MSETLPAEIPPEQPITAEESATGSTETDSAIGDDISTYTDSLRSSLLESLKENGRGYHKCQYSPMFSTFWRWQYVSSLQCAEKAVANI